MIAKWNVVLMYMFTSHQDYVSVQDCVSVRIPRIDRSSTDSHRLACVVVQLMGEIMRKSWVTGDFNFLGASLAF